MQEFRRVRREALHDFELPIVRFGADGMLEYANEAAISLLGMRPAGGLSELSFTALFQQDSQQDPKPENSERTRGVASTVASTYRANFTRPQTGERIPISVYAFPEVDENGEIIGLIAILRDLRERIANAAMHEAIETLRDNKELLQLVAQHLSQLVQFDDFRITAISKDRRHLRRVFSTNKNDEISHPFRWWVIPDFIRSTMEQEVAKIIDVKERFSTPEYREMARKDVAMQRFLESGVKWVLSIPIWRGNQIVAFIGVDSTHDESFSANDLEMCERLPLAQAALMALHYEEQAVLRTSLDLMRELNGNTAHLTDVAQTLTSRLVEYFDWDRVTIFQQDESTGTFRVLSKSMAAGASLAEQVPDAGTDNWLKTAFDEGRIISTDEPSESAGGPQSDGTRAVLSRLTVPVPGSIKRWIVHVESRLAKAFATEEIDTVKGLVAEAALILERAAILGMREAILKSVNDAVIETDQRGIIRDLNPAAEVLVAREKREMIGASLKQYLPDEKLQMAVEDSREFAPCETQFIATDGTPVPVLLSCSILPPEIGGKVFVASDLTYQKEVQKVDLIKEVFRQAAIESRVPIALSAAWLDQIRANDEGTSETVEKILKQLRKADLPLERLLRRAAGSQEHGVKTAFTGVAGVIEYVLAQFPQADRDQVAFEVKSNGGDIIASAPEDVIRFCVESMLSFSLRTKPQSRKVSMELLDKDAQALVIVRGEWSPDLGAENISGIRNRWRRQAISDLTLGQDVIEETARAVGGDFRFAMQDGLRLELRLPKA